MPTKYFGSLRPKFFAEKTWYPLLSMKLFDTPNFLKHWTEAHKKFRHCETKNLQVKNAISLTMHKFFHYPQIIWIIERMPTKFFGSLRPKFFAGKTWYPLIYMKLFDTPTFLKHWTDAHKMFRHCETKFFNWKMWYPLLCIKFPVTPNYLKHWRDAHKIFRHCETTNFRRKDVIHPVMHKIFVTPIYLKHRTDAQGNFRQCEAKIFRRKFVIPPIIHKMFRYLKLTETLKGCPKKFFGTMRSKIFAEKTWYPLLSMKLFDTPNYLKHWRDAHKKFRHCETKKIRQKTCYLLLCKKIFPYPNFSETLKECPQIFSEMWDKNFSTEICYTPYYP